MCGILERTQVCNLIYYDITFICYHPIKKDYLIHFGWLHFLMNDWRINFYFQIFYNCKCWSYLFCSYWYQNVYGPCINIYIYFVKYTKKLVSWRLFLPHLFLFKYFSPKQPPILRPFVHKLIGVYLSLSYFLFINIDIL